MNEDTDSGETEQDPNQAFFEKAERALRDLFEQAKAAHELHFAMALMPEFRGEQDAGWSTADESVRAYDEFAELVRSLPKTPARVRVVLAFYMHVAEGAGFYEIPKKLLLTIEGRGNNMWPFQNLVERHRASGEIIAPNANQIMKDLIGHASELGLTGWRRCFAMRSIPVSGTLSLTPTTSSGRMDCASGDEMVGGPERFPGRTSRLWLIGV
jgi:hypothetical protein